MHQELASKLAEDMSRLPEIGFKTGVSVQTMRNIIADPKAKRQKVVVSALNKFFKIKD